MPHTASLSESDHSTVSYSTDSTLDVHDTSRGTSTSVSDDELVGFGGVEEHHNEPTLDVSQNRIDTIDDRLGGSCNYCEQSAGSDHPFTTMPSSHHKPIEPTRDVPTANSREASICTVQHSSCSSWPYRRVDDPQEGPIDPRFRLLNPMPMALASSGSSHPWGRDRALANKDELGSIEAGDSGLSGADRKAIGVELPSYRTSRQMDAQAHLDAAAAHLAAASKLEAEAAASEEITDSLHREASSLDEDDLLNVLSASITDTDANEYMHMQCSSGSMHDFSMTSSSDALQPSVLAAGSGVEGLGKAAPPTCSHPIGAQLAMRSLSFRTTSRAAVSLCYASFPSGCCIHAVAETPDAEG